jgi:NAD(P)-dependent dehydrogenase (short-subunit alcohol dehydrogenase family)
VSKTASTDRKAYIITGPTSGIGRATAFELASHGIVVLVGRDPKFTARVVSETRALLSTVAA